MTQKEAGKRSQYNVFRLSLMCDNFEELSISYPTLIAIFNLLVTMDKLLGLEVSTFKKQ